MAPEDIGVRPSTPSKERISALGKPRPGPPGGCDCDDSVHSAFTFGQVQVSRPQLFTVGTAIQSSWPPSSDVLIIYGDAMTETKGIPSAKVVTSTVQNVKMYHQGLAMKMHPRRHRFLTRQQVRELRFVLQSEMNSRAA